MSAFVSRAGLFGCICGALVLASCARDPIVTGMDTVTVGNWRVERGTDRVTGAPISSAVLPTRSVSTTKIIYPPPAHIQLSCFKEAPAVTIHFEFKIGSTRNAEFGYRFDDKPGHIGDVRFVDDYKSVIIENKDEVARFVNEMTTSNVLYVLIRSLTVGRTTAEFHLEGAPEAINAALAGCPVKPPAPTSGAPVKRSAT